MPGPLGLTGPLGRDAEHVALPPDVNLGPYLNRVIWTLAALAALFLGLRMYCKFLRSRQLWWDDYFLIASWVALVVSVALQTAGTAYGLGRLFAYLNPEQVTAVALYSICAGFCSILATCWSKTSFAISLLRISNGGVRVFVWFIIISTNLVLGANGAIQWAQCWPIQKRWHYDMEGSCWPSEIVQNFNTFVAAFSGFMDILLALLPWKIIWTVAINKREKIGALAAMSTGVISGVMAFLKIKTLYVIGNDNVTTVDLFIFGTAEPATIIMAASIPILRMLIRPQPKPKPARFIELDRRTATLSERHLPPSSQGRDPEVEFHERTSKDAKHNAEEAWLKDSVKGHVSDC
ncbi:hypothetical protein VTI74DRAFT_3926 [Chaetomium olivicolor]